MSANPTQSSQPSRPWPDFVALPRVELHCHIDGAVRPQTLAELAAAVGHPLGRLPPAELRRALAAPASGGSLDSFLAVFETFYPLLRCPGVAQRIARELVEDMARDGVVQLEARCCPTLLTGAGGHDARAVLRETLAGLAEGAAATGIGAGLIVCLYRSLSFAQNAALLELALQYHGAGVIGVDLAGPERLPAAPLAPLFARAHAAGLPITVHAGEAAGPKSVAEAWQRLHARRIGHGVALARDPTLAARLAAAGVVLECCPTSNVRTGAVASLAEHPFAELRRAGLAVTLNTDDPAVCATTSSAEHALAAREWGLGAGDFAQLVRTAVDAAFLPAAERTRLAARVEAGLAAWPGPAPVRTGEGR